MSHFKTMTALLLLFTHSSDAARRAWIENALQNSYHAPSSSGTSLMEDKAKSAELVTILQSLEETPCEYATGHEVRHWGFNIAGGANALKDVQDKINSIASVCQSLTKTEDKIARHEGLITKLKADILFSAGELENAKSDKEVYDAENADVNDESCKAAYASTNVLSKAKHRLFKAAGAVSNWFSDLRASAEEKIARATTRSESEAHRAAQLQNEAAMAARCRERDSISARVAKLEKFLSDSERKKSESAEQAAKEHLNLVEAKAAKDAAKAAAVETIKAFAADVTRKLEASD